MYIVIGSIFFALALLWTGDRDYKDAVDQQKHYCQMVESEAWPNWRELDCGKLYPTKAELYSF